MLARDKRKKIACCFVVGAPRSGTTLLQARLASHPALISFPETHFFARATQNRSRFHRRLRLLHPASRERAEAFIRNVSRQWGLDPNSNLRNLRSPWLNGYARQFFGCLDKIVQQQPGVQGWIEKTPGHVHHIAKMERAVPTARVIHIIRSGIAVVGSLYDVTHRYPESWGGAWSIDRCIDTWNKDISCSLAHRGRKHHMLIRYEAFVDEPERYVNAMWRFLGMPEYSFDPKQHVNGESSIIESFEQWKSDATGPIMRSRYRRIDELFEPREIQAIREGLEFDGEVPEDYFYDL